MENSEIDLREVQRLSAKAAGKEPPTFEGPYLFWYTLWTFVENKTFQTLNDIQAKEKMSRYPKMEVFYCKFPNSQTPAPGILKTRKGLQTETVSSHEQVSDLILMKTGVKVPESDLRSKQKMRMDDKPLVNRVMDLKRSINEQEKHDREIQRILDCLKKNDPKSRKECLTNCKTK